MKHSHGKTLDAKKLAVASGPDRNIAAGVVHNMHNIIMYTKFRVTTYTRMQCIVNGYIETTKILFMDNLMFGVQPNIKLSTKNFCCFYTATATEKDVTT